MPMLTSPMSFSLAEQVHQAVVFHPHLKQRRVQSRTQNGRVTLNGSVQSYYEKQLAQEALRNIEGVTAIENRLEVIWS